MDYEDNMDEDKKRRALLRASLFGVFFNSATVTALKFLFPTGGRGLCWQCFALLQNSHFPEDI